MKLQPNMKILINMTNINYTLIIPGTFRAFFTHCNITFLHYHWQAHFFVKLQKHLKEKCRAITESTASPRMPVLDYFEERHIWIMRLNIKKGKTLATIHSAMFS